MKDQNGNRLTKNVRRESDGTWGANVWFGHNPPTSLRRYYYATQSQARAADISDEPGRNGCVRFGKYA
jgi:hypothetical protein